MNQNLKAILLVFALGVCNLWSSSSYAQLGGLKNKLLKSKNEKEEVKEEKVPALVYDKPFPPGIVYHSLLKHMEVRSDGILLLRHVSISFVPTKDENGNEVDFHYPDRFHIVLKKEGEEIFDTYYKPQYTFKVYTKFEIDEFAKKGNTDKLKDPLEAGKYELNFFFDDKMIGRYPFEIVELKNDDPYAEVTSKKFAKGFWDDYGYLFWEEKPEQGVEPSLQMCIFGQLENIKEKEWRYDFQGEIYKNGTYLGKTSDLPFILKNEWGNHTMLFSIVPKNEKFSTKKLLRRNDLVDGNYEVKVFLGKDKSIASKYQFTVVNGKIVPVDKQNRENVDQLDFIEGLNEAFWVKKIK